MSPRNNEDRMTPKHADPPLAELAEANTNSFSFVTPTEFVDLPSKGEYYPKGHPLHKQDTVEIRYMTAKDEDILTSRTLLKKGIVLDRLIKNILVNKKVQPEDLLIGDKNAIIVAARTTGYGSEYTTRLNCPSCGEYVEYSFDLEEAVVNNGELTEDIQRTENGTFIIRLPKLDVDVETRLMTGRDEAHLSKLSASKKKHKLGDSLLTDQFKQFIVSVNGNTGEEIINALVEHMPAYDSRFLRRHYQAAVPNIDLTQSFECSNCELEQEMEVPFTADFFWSK